MKYTHWDVGGFEREVAVTLCENGVNPLVSVLLASRGITDISDVQAVIGMAPVQFHDPYLMADMDKAVARIDKALKNKERIAIYGDYDVDGMTASVILALWLKSKGADFEIYIPGRSEEGYGLNCAALEELKSQDIGLVVTVDCGITAFEEAEYAKKLGLGLVITDHHECREELPNADAVVDPKRPDCNYPFKSLAGVGVAFKLVCALEKDYLSDEILDKYCELVAVGTVADVMQVTGENRDLIKRGLNVLGKNTRPGLNQLLIEAGGDISTVTTSTIGFMLAPRLNAAGRMGTPMLSVDLLLTKSPDEAKRLAAKLCKLNTERRNLEIDIFEQANAMLQDKKPDGPIVLCESTWYQGVTGIVAAKLADRYRLPAIIISVEDGIGRGSCRSFGSFNIYRSLCSCADILESFGGHEMAAGVTVREDKIEELRSRIKKEYEKHVEGGASLGLRLDFEVEKPKLLILPNVEALSDLEPFGSGNPAPCLCMTGVKLISVESIGAGKHSRLRIEKAGKKMDCIYFSMPAESLGVKEGMDVDIAFEPQVNEFRGKTNVQLQLQDIRPAAL
ncbi:MAG: single-stranded-DNA-specific exonuclease RecJ [Oscillospiraceae bacterium]|nr:single-stranded-DNA-specific exonuclease RecJ [Oscillospiraceae bacterium]MCL2278222.1 single-stranded-DNA-specific exonuclease RecJ [Oscillospiraceae bacterium]